MPTGQVMLVAVVAATLYWGSTGMWHGIKKATHAIGCVAQHGKKCIKK